MSTTPGGIAYERAGESGGLPVVLVHAGVADRRMWDAQWSALVDAGREVVRLDLRGFGDSADRPEGVLSPVTDLLAVLDDAGIDRCHLVGASLGAGVVVEAALARPSAVASLLLAAPGGSLITELTPDLGEFFAAERAALSAGDLDAAVEANLRTWVDGGRPANAVAADLRASVGRMQRRAFEITTDWDDVEEADTDPIGRLVEITAPTLVLLGGHDLQAIGDTARRVVRGIRGARLVEWPDVAHLPSTERPAQFTDLLLGWFDEVRDDA